MTMNETRTLNNETLAGYIEALACRVRSDEPIVNDRQSLPNGESIAISTHLNDREGVQGFDIRILRNSAARTPRPLVGILTGSLNDLGTVGKAREVLNELGVDHEVRVLSAHRTPELTLAYVRSAEERGIEVLVACAGMAAHLAGVAASNSLLPVVGVPIASGPLSGLDALLSTAQMPPGVPVATVAVDGGRNAALLAARVLARKRPDIRTRLEELVLAETARCESATHLPEPEDV